MSNLERRRFLGLAALGAGGLAALGRPSAGAAAITGAADLARGGRDVSPATGAERTAIPSACWQCVTQCPINGYLEDGRLVKIEGNPESVRTGGALCARGQAGVNQVDNPDRLLHPLVREGARGEGKWRRIGWDQALELLVEGGEIAGRRVTGLRELRDAGTPERFLFHYGRTVGSDWLILMAYFLPAYGTGSVGDHNSICMSAGGVAATLTGGPPRFTDFDRAAIILNFGNSMLEAGTDHLPMAQRFAGALDRGAKVYTFDPRLSNTAARSTRWIPVKPATDLAVILAMCREIVASELHDESMIEEHTNTTVDALKDHLEPYTLEWAARESGVPAGRIRSLAVEYGTTKPGICVSFRGAFMHHNGVQTQRAIYLLQALTGNLDPGGGMGAPPRWRYPFAFPEGEPKNLDVFNGEPGAYSYPIYGVSHQILSMIDRGPERPSIYMTYCHNPVYANGDCRDNERVFSDEEKIPFLVAIDVTLSETSLLADLVLPDATYLERWTCDGRPSPEGVPEYQLRQPMHPPRGEARNFCDVACQLAERLGFEIGFGTAEEFVRETCNATPGVKEAGGFEYMRAHGLWSDPDAEPMKVPPRPMELVSETLAEAGFSALPGWMAAPEHEAMADDELVLITFKVAVQTHSRTQGCKWLTELHHSNPAWIHPETAAARGIRNGDRIVVRSEVGEIVTTARVTEGIHPGAIAVSHHCGHWGHGAYASGETSHVHAAEPDSRLKWWEDNGVHPNLIIPNRGDPIAGAMCWNDTVVTVTKT